MSNNEFTDTLELAEVKVTFKKVDPTKSRSYRPVIVLPTVSKMFERRMHRQMYIFVERFLSIYM